jgi:GNAT superfamily N-acetyltransferase
MFFLYDVNLANSHEIRGAVFGFRSGENACMILIGEGSPVIVTLVRDSSRNPDFRELVTMLDADLAQRYGALQTSYDQYNAIEALDTVVILHMDRKPAACGSFKPYDEATVEIKRMFVRPECRGKGLAGMVLQELERWAQESGYTHAILETGRKQAEAIRLYQKHGYELIANYGQYKEIANSICYKKAFNSKSQKL